MTACTWSLKSWYERRTAVKTAIPEAASAGQRSSQTRRDASTTSKGAGSKPVRVGAAAPRRRLGATGQRLSDDSVGLEALDLSRAEPKGSEELCVVLAEQRGVTPVPPLRASREPHRQRAV